MRYAYDRGCRTASCTADLHPWEAASLTPGWPPLLLLGSIVPPAPAAAPLTDALAACSLPTLLTVRSALLLLAEPSLFDTWQW